MEIREGIVSAPGSQKSVAGSNEMELLQSRLGCDLNIAHPCAQRERINDCVCWALVIPLANESWTERHAMGPLGSLQPGISRVCYIARLGSVPGTKASLAPTAFPLPAHQLPSGCLFSVTQVGWILLKIWRLVRTRRCLERLPLIINTTAGNDVVEKKKKITLIQYTFSLMFLQRVHCPEKKVRGFLFFFSP